MSQPSPTILSQQTVNRLIVESLRVHPLTDEQIHELLDEFTEMEVTAAMVKGWHRHQFKLEWDPDKHSFYIGLGETADTIKPLHHNIAVTNSSISTPSRFDGNKQSPDVKGIRASTTKDQK